MINEIWRNVTKKVHKMNDGVSVSFHNNFSSINAVAQPVPMKVDVIAVGFLIL